MLKTDRLKLRTITLDDLEYLLEMNNDYEVMKYISSDFKLTSASQECKSIHRQLAYYEENPGFGLWMVDTAEDTIGWVSLKYNLDVKGYEIGYRLRKKYWNKGYATEAAKGILEYARDKNIEEIYAIAMKTNLNSTSVMKKAGMQFDREDFLYNEDVVVYSMHL